MSTNTGMSVGGAAAVAAAVDGSPADGTVHDDEGRNCRAGAPPSLPLGDTDTLDAALVGVSFSLLSNQSSTLF